MRKLERYLFGLLVLLFVGYVVAEQYAPRPLDWTLTFSQVDKAPYGAYILYDRLEDFFDGERKLSFNTLYELRDSVNNLIILTSKFGPSGPDIGGVYEILGRGSDVLIAADYFSSSFVDTLGLKLDMVKILHSVEGVLSQDSLIVSTDTETFYLPVSFVKNTFHVEDSSGWLVHAGIERPVVISKRFEGGGRLVLSSIPLIFTNYGMLKSENYRLVESVLQLMSSNQVTYNRFYHAGRVEPSSPLRYLLSQTSLRWALYLTLFLLVAFLWVESRRKQRAIPLIGPKVNTTVQYIKTIGGLYHREGNHRGAAMKIIQYFLKSLKEKYFISSIQGESTYHVLATKVGLAAEEVIQTFELIERIKKSNRISEEELKKLHQKISLFNII